MKKTLLITSLFTLFCFIAKAQVLNQPANWPNENWSVTGTYNPAYLYADPTSISSFSFDDDDAGGTSDNNVASESPIIGVSLTIISAVLETISEQPPVLNVIIT